MISLNPNSKESGQVLDLFESYVRLLSLSQLAKHAYAKGYRTKVRVTRKGKRRGGRPLNKTDLVYILRNPIYGGKVRHNGELYDGVHKPIVPWALCEKVQTLLSRNQHGRAFRKGNGAMRPRFLLKGLIRCLDCGSIMTPWYNGKGIGYYRCHKVLKLDKSACRSRAVNSKAIEKIVLDRLSHLASDPATVKEIVERTKALQNHELPEKMKELGRLEKKFRGLDEQAKNLVAVLAEHGTKTGQCKSIVDQLTTIEAAKLELTQGLTLLGQEMQLLKTKQVNADLLVQNLRQLDAVISELNPDEQSELMHLFIDGITYDGINGKLTLKLLSLPALNLSADELRGGANSVKIGCATPTLCKPKSRFYTSSHSASSIRRRARSGFCRRRHSRMPPA